MNPSSLLMSFEHNGRCYLVSQNNVNYEEARNTCKSVNGTYDLISIVSAVEQKFIGHILHSLSISNPSWLNIRIWIGLKGSKGNMSWSDGLPLDFGSDYKFPWTNDPNMIPQGDVSIIVNNLP